jgi:HD-GYP domain-containing protein (c-di-GMP phosphodiesterase class II)
MRRSADDFTGFLPVSIATLLPGNVLGVRLYIRDSSATMPRLYRSAEIPFELKDRDRLLSSGLRALYININDHGRYQEYLRNNLESILGNEGISVNDRFSSLNAVVRDVLADSFRANDVDASVRGADQLADYCVELLSRDDCVAGEIIGLLNHDYQTFTHSANVAYYCVLLARSLGMTDPAELKEVAVGGFLHDLGKLDIPERVLNKPGKLTDHEYDLIRDHPRSGFLKLCDHEDVTFAQLMMVYQHHERVDGGGYPVGCSKHELHEWARLCSVVDVYEALTSNRPYRPRLSAVEILHIMTRDSGTKFDEQFLHCWMSALPRKR